MADMCLAPFIIANVTVREFIIIPGRRGVRVWLCSFYLISFLFFPFTSPLWRVFVVWSMFCFRNARYKCSLSLSQLWVVQISTEAPRDLFQIDHSSESYKNRPHTQTHQTKGIAVKREDSIKYDYQRNYFSFRRDREKEESDRFK